MRKIINESLIGDIKHFFDIASPEILEKDIVKKLKNFYDNTMKIGGSNNIEVKSKNNEPEVIDNKVIDNDTYIISRGNSSFGFTIFFGGTPSSRYGAKKMKSDVGNELKDKNIIYSDWENSISSLKDSLKKVYPNAMIDGVVGFSKGGLRAWPATEGGYKFVGLIDPSIESDYQSINPTVNNSKMTYLKNRTWGLNGLKYAAGKLGKSNVYAVEGLSHEGMVSDFVKRFKEYF